MRAHIVFTAALTLLTASSLSAADGYLRLGGGVEQSAKTRVRDRDCASTQPPALFGCGQGADSRALGAYGDFGRSSIAELAGGVTLRGGTRLELALASRGGLDLDAQANFVGVAGPQPVRAKVRSLSTFAIVAHDFGSEAWLVRPSLQAGAGAARNRLGDSRYEFPALSPDAVTIMPGGTRTNFAWMAGAGAAIALSPAVTVDVTLRYSDLGEVRGDTGPATIIRPTRTLTLNIDGTRAPLRTRALVVSIRYRMGAR